MEISFENIVLRDMKKEDIEDYVRWFTVQTEWTDWDAPWEQASGESEQEQRKSWTQYYESVKSLPDDVLRWKFEIDYQGKHIGWVCSYMIDENYEWIASDASDGAQQMHRTVGIDLCEPESWGKGAGTAALRAMIRYYAGHGYTEIYTQTWSGNHRMIRAAQKLGFAVCSTVAGEVEVCGKKYDGLTLVLKTQP